MQTWLPYADFYKSAEVLDRLRLGKQRVETWQILQALTNLNYGWQNHPATKMWRGSSWSLCNYGTVICEIWKSKGYRDSILNKIIDYSIDRFDCPDMLPPLWLGDERIHSSHRASLLFKNYDFYKQFGWKEKPEIKYYWPVK